MGLRGPLRNPNSRRGRKEAERSARLSVVPSPSVAAPATPSAGLPEYLALEGPAREIHEAIVADLKAAGVPFERIDYIGTSTVAEILASRAEVSRILSGSDLSPDQRFAALKLMEHYAKELIQWVPLIGGTAYSRARIGVRPAQPKKLGPLAQILALKQGRGNGS